MKTLAASCISSKSKIMKVISRPRNAGKTSELIKESAEHGYYIITMDHDSARKTVEQAAQMGLDIPFPLTYREFKNRAFYARGIKGFLVDNIDGFLEQIFSDMTKGVPVEAVTMTSPNWLTPNE